MCVCPRVCVLCTYTPKGAVNVVVTTDLDKIKAISELDLWRDAETALQLDENLHDTSNRQHEESCEDAVDDATGRSLLQERANAARQSFCTGPNGLIHYCSSTCPHLLPNADCGYTCPFSGIVFGNVCEHVEGCTGRRIWSADPDAKGGAPVGGWRRKKNAYVESKRAWSTGHAYDYLDEALQLDKDDEEVNETNEGSNVDGGAEARVVSGTHRSRRAKSRGGRNCGLLLAAPRSDIRKRSVKRTAECVKVQAGTVSGGEGELFASSQAESVSRTMEQTERVPTTPKKTASGIRKDAAFEDIQNVFKLLVGSRKKQAATTPLDAKVNSKLLDSDALYISAVRKYVRAQLAANRQPALDDLHNISLAVEKVVAAEKAKLETVVSSAGQDLLQNHRFQMLSHALLYELWVACCRTPTMRECHVGHETVKTFVAGAMYAFKRGLALRSGVVLVPAVAEFETALPRSRADAKHSQTKALHASSHRGMQAIHRCLASDTPERIGSIFRSASKAAEALHQYVKAYRQRPIE